MNRSAGEMRAEMLKAARGACTALGTAEDLAVASAWMTDAALAEALDLLETAPARLDEMVCALDVDEPVSGPGSSNLAAALRAAQTGAPILAWPRALAPHLWARLNALAARTYVPETATSRQTGAGAGNIDND